MSDRDKRLQGMRTTARSKFNFHYLIYVLFITFQVHGRCKKNNISGSKHYLTVASGVMMSVFVSPVIAAVTVGKEQTTWPPSVLHSEERDSTVNEHVFAELVIETDFFLIKSPQYPETQQFRSDTKEASCAK